VFWTWCRLLLQTRAPKPELWAFQIAVRPVETSPGNVVAFAGSCDRTGLIFIILVPLVSPGLRNETQHDPSHHPSPPPLLTLLLQSTHKKAPHFYYISRGFNSVVFSFSFSPDEITFDDYWMYVLFWDFQSREDSFCVYYNTPWSLRSSEMLHGVAR